MCANHVVKCYTSRLYSIAKESKGTRSLLSAPRIKRIKNGARKTVSHYAKILRDCNGSTEDLKKEKSRLIQELASDLRNGPLHVFGSHDGCKSYFCNGSKADNVYQAVPKIHLRTKQTVSSQMARAILLKPLCPLWLNFLEESR